MLCVLYHNLNKKHTCQVLYLHILQYTQTHSISEECVCVCVHVCCRVQLFATPGLQPAKAPLSMGILQTRILEWVATSSSRGSSWPRDWTHICCVACTAGRFFTTEHRGSPVRRYCACFADEKIETKGNSELLDQVTSKETKSSSSQSQCFFLYTDSLWRVQDGTNRDTSWKHWPSCLAHMRACNVRSFPSPQHFCFKNSGPKEKQPNHFLLWEHSRWWLLNKPNPF